MNTNEYITKVKKLRNLVIMHPNFEYVMDELVAAYDFHCQAGMAKNILCMGPSGTGKSTLIQQLMQKSLVNNPDDSTQPVVVVNTPSKPTVKNFAEAFLIALHDPFAANNQNAIQKTTRLVEIVRRKRVQMLIVDEFQHFAEHTNRSAFREVSDWFKNFIDEVNVSTILMGLEKAQAIFNSNEQIRRRFSQTIILEPFVINDTYGYKVFASVIRELDEQLGLESPLILNEETVTRIYYATNGLIDYLIKLLIGSLEIVYREGKHGLDMPVMEQAFKKCIWHSCSATQNPFNQAFVEQKLDKANMPFFVG